MTVRKTYAAVQLSIVSEKVFESAIERVLTEEGAKGYTVFEGGGNSAFHLHPNAKTSLMDALHLIKIEVIVLDHDKAEKMANRLMEEFFDHQPGIVSLSEVKVFRAQKF
jgi:PII-like signaling protein